MLTAFEIFGFEQEKKSMNMSKRPSIKNHFLIWTGMAEKVGKIGTIHNSTLQNTKKKKKQERNTKFYCRRKLCWKISCVMKMKISAKVDSVWHKDDWKSENIQQSMIKPDEALREIVLSTFCSLLVLFEMHPFNRLKLKLSTTHIIMDSV